MSQTWFYIATNFLTQNAMEDARIKKLAFFIAF